MAYRDTTSLFNAKVENNGIWVSPSDFSRDKRGEIAWTIAFACNVRCADKDSLLQLLYGFADDIIQCIQRPE